MRARRLQERIGATLAAKDSLRQRREHGIRGGAVILGSVHVSHDARSGERNASPRTELLDVDGRNRASRLTDAGNDAKRPHAAERLRQGGTSDAVEGDIDTAPCGQI